MYVWLVLQRIVTVVTLLLFIDQLSKLHNTRLRPSACHPLLIEPNRLTHKYNDEFYSNPVVQLQSAVQPGSTELASCQTMIVKKLSSSIIHYVVVYDSVGNAVPY